MEIYFFKSFEPEAFQTEIVESDILYKEETLTAVLQHEESLNKSSF